MAEGDSVYRVARRLDAGLAGRSLRTGELRVAAYANAELSGRTVLGTDTHGKHLLTRFDDRRTLHTHLRMSGSWIVVRPGRRLPRSVLPDVRVRLVVADGPTAAGVNLPVVELVPTDQEARVVGHLGPDPLRADWDVTEATRRLSADPSRALVTALLDQRSVAGFGNLWANELCFLSGHSPWTTVGDVDVSAVLRLGARALRFSATSPTGSQVTTGNTRRGERHWVAGRAGRPCLRCGTPVRAVQGTGGDGQPRHTWWCPFCQPGPRSGSGPR